MLSINDKVELHADMQKKGYGKFGVIKRIDQLTPGHFDYEVALLKSSLPKCYKTIWFCGQAISKAS